MSLARTPGMYVPFSCSAGLPFPRVSTSSGAVTSSRSVVLRWSTVILLRVLPSSGPIATRIDMNERSVPGAGWIDACPANYFRMSGLDPGDSGLDYLGVAYRDAPVV